jgi:AcrR family transcriptional regulator
VSRRIRRDPRAAATRIALIEAAEKMFADSGVEAVSTRQIGAAIGSLNNTVVAYHFGSKDALIEAIYRYRLPQIESRRSELLAQAEAFGEAAKLPRILRALWLPLFEQVNDSGQHTYARFLRSMMREGIFRTRQIITSDFPTAATMVERIRPALPFGPGEIWDLRWQLAASMVLDALTHIDKAHLGNSTQARRLFEDAMLMAEAALTCPPA